MKKMNLTFPMIRLRIWAPIILSLSTLIINCAKPITDDPMVSIPAGTFTMGHALGEDSEKPEHIISVAAFKLDRYLATAHQYEVFVNQLSAQTQADAKPKTPKWGPQYCNNEISTGIAKPGKQNHPATCVSWFQAKAYCEKQGKRLPTEVEYEYAAKGILGSKYPWGDAEPTEHNACWNTETKNKKTETCPVGQYPKTLLGQLNPAGLADLAGNAWEWTSSAALTYPEHRECGPNVRCEVRGGSWYSDEAKFLRSSLRRDDNPSKGYFDLGFRCAKSN